jgi:hypothetical protein
MFTILDYIWQTNKLLVKEWERLSERRFKDKIHENAPNYMD